MSAWAPETRDAFERELDAGRACFAAADLDGAFGRFERAHILGQRNTRAHVRAHWWMLKVGRARRDRREVLGQWMRIVAAATMSRIWVPLGNTGGANVSPVRRMALPDDLRELL